MENNIVLYTVRIYDTVYGYVTDVFDTTDKKKAYEILERVKNVIGTKEKTFMAISYNSGIEENYNWIYFDNLSSDFIIKVFKKEEV